jgi:hypothetical protein
MKAAEAMLRAMKVDKEHDESTDQSTTSFFTCQEKFEKQYVFKEAFNIKCALFCNHISYDMCRFVYGRMNDIVLVQMTEKAQVSILTVRRIANSSFLSFSISRVGT